MANSEAGWTKELPQSQGWYWVRSSPLGLPVVVEFFPAMLDRREPCVRYPGKIGLMVVDTSAEWLGPISPSDAEQLMELRKAALILLEHSGPTSTLDGMDSQVLVRRKDLYALVILVDPALNPKHPEKETQ